MNGSGGWAEQRRLNTPSSPMTWMLAPGQVKELVEVARELPALATIVADLAPSVDASPRPVRLQLSFGFLAYPGAPWVVRLSEDDAPPGVQPIEWLWGSRTCISCVEDALLLLHTTEGLLTWYAVT